MIVAIVSFVMLSYYFVEEQKSYIHIPPINAVPQDAPIFIESRDFNNLLDELKSNNKIWNELLNIKQISEINKKALVLDSLMDANSDIAEIVSEKSVIISTHLVGKDNISFLFIVNIFSLSNEEKVLSYMSDLLDNKEKSSRTYDNVEIVSAKLSEDKRLEYTIANGFLLMSFSPLLIEESIRQLNSGNSLLTDKNLKEISQTAGKNVLANLYINYRTLPKLISVLLRQKYEKANQSFSPFANWGEFDLNIKNDMILLNGFTNAISNPENYLSVFQHIKPASSDIQKVIPSGISAYIALSFDDAEQFYSNYKAHLESVNKLELHTNKINEMNKTTGMEAGYIFLSLLKNNMAILFEDINRADFNKGNYIVIETQSSDEASRQMLAMIKNYTKSNRKKTSDYLTTIGVENNEYTIYKMPVKNMPAKLFGSTFAKAYPNYFTFVDDYMVFGSSVKNLTNYLMNIENEKTLSNDKNYVDFAGYTESDYNYYFYINISRSINLIASHITDELNTSLEKNISTLGKFQAVGFQLKNENNMLYSNALAKYNPSGRQTSTAVWETRLDTTIDFKPFFFTNHYTLEKEIFVQDQKNKIYLVSNAGRILWEKQLNEKIIGNIYEADYYNNNKLQILFGTKHGIHLIDRLGNYVENYPKKLHSPAVSGISMFDYDNNKNYRIAVAAEDLKIYLFDIRGNEVDGWRYPKTSTPIKTEPRHFRIKATDYIVFADNNNFYVVDRRGSKKAVAAQIPDVAKNALIGLDINHKGRSGKARFVLPAESGKLIYVYTDGKTETKQYTNTNQNYYFEYSDVNNNGFNDPIFISGTLLSVWEHGGKEIFNYTFTTPPRHPPSIYRFSATDTRIGVVEQQSGLIYLFNHNGNLYSKFPLTGNSMFSIGMLQSATGQFNLVVGNDEGFLLNYEIE